MPPGRPLTGALKTPRQAHHGDRVHPTVGHRPPVVPHRRTSADAGPGGYSAHMAPKPKELLEELSHPGPHEVRRGNLALVGLPGIIYTPSSGKNLPAIAFGHGWMQAPTRYVGLLRHLASWGFVVVAPGSEGGPLPSHRRFAADLLQSLSLVRTVRLGPSGISVSSSRLGLAGHSTGGGAALLAAASAATSASPVSAVATVAPSQTAPSASVAARTVTAPGLHLAVDGDVVAPPVGHALPIAKAWQGPVTVRGLAKSNHLAVTEGFGLSQLVLSGKPHRPTQRLVNALFAAHFLVHVAGESRFEPLLDADVKHAKITLSQKPADV